MDNKNNSKNIGKRFFRTISKEIIFGDCEIIQTANGSEILIKEPYTVKNGKAMPYMYDELMKSPAAIQIHPMNVLWSVPLDEFDEINKIYIEATSGIISTTNRIVI